MAGIRKIRLLLVFIWHGIQTYSQTLYIKARQVEYRFPIRKIMSGVAFYDIGQVQNSMNYFKIDNFHHSFGFGPRFSFGSNENSILGMDFGFSDEGMMVFFHAGHSF